MPYGYVSSATLDALLASPPVTKGLTDSRWGLLFAANTYEISLSLDLTATETGDGPHSWDCAAELLCQADTPTTPAEALRIRFDATGAGGQVDVDFYGASLASVPYATPPSTMDAVVTFKHLRLYSDPTNERYVLMWHSLTVVVDGSTEFTGTIDYVASDGIPPTFTPLLGWPPQITGTATAAAASGAPPTPPTFDSQTEVSLTVSGGLRWKLEGSSDWDSYPVTLFSDWSAPSSGPYGLDGSGVVVSTSSYGTHINVSAMEHTIRDATGTCPGATPGPASRAQSTQNGEVYLLPDWERSFQRVDEVNHAALIYRGAFPRTTMRRQRSTHLAGDPSLPTTTSADSTVHERLPKKYYVETNARHDAEHDGMPDFLYSPVIVNKNQSYVSMALADGCDDIAFPLPDDLISDSVTITYPLDVDENIGGESPDLLDYIYTLDMVSRIANYWGNPHWSFVFPEINWELGGSPTNWNDYWGLVQQQWLDYAGLATGEARQTRNSIVWDCLDVNNVWFSFLTNFPNGFRWRGISRFITDSRAVPTSYSYVQGDSALFTVTGGTVVYNPTRITITPTSTPVVVDLDLGVFTGAQYQSAHLSTHLNQDWDTPNIAGVSAYVVGVDGDAQFIAADADLKNVTVPLPRGTANKFAGSWGIDNGAGVLGDTGVDDGANGISSATMADPERSQAFQLLPGSTRSSLRFEIDVTTLGTPIDILYPILYHDNNEQEPAVIVETANAQSLIYRTVN